MVEKGHDVAIPVLYLSVSGFVAYNFKPAPVGMGESRPEQACSRTGDPTCSSARARKHSGLGRRIRLGPHDRAISGSVRLAGAYWPCKGAHAKHEGCVSTEHPRCSSPARVERDVKKKLARCQKDRLRAVTLYWKPRVK